MKQDKRNTPVFVTGVERSGISIVAKIIDICGAWTGATSEMYENLAIKKQVDGYYNSIGISPAGQYPLPDTSEMLIPSNWKGKVDSILLEGGYDYDCSQLWMYKGSRLCQIWPVWHYAYPNAKWIIVRRRTADVVQSCLKTGFMTAFANEEIQKLIQVETEQKGWLWWIHEHERLFVDMIESGLNCKVVWPERMIRGDYHQVYEMLDWLGLPWDKKIVTSIGPLLG